MPVTKKQGVKRDMATIEVCDICGTGDDVTRRAYSTGERTYNGVDYDYESEIIDLCPVCELRLIRCVINDIILGGEIGGQEESRNKINKILINAFKKIEKSVRCKLVGK